MAWPTYNEAPQGAGVGERVSVSPGLPSRTTLPELRGRPATELPGVGPRIAAALKDLGVLSLADLVSHYPSRHEDL